MICRIWISLSDDLCPSLQTELNPERRRLLTGGKMASNNTLRSYSIIPCFIFVEVRDCVTLWINDSQLTECKVLELVETVCWSSMFNYQFSRKSLIRAMSCEASLSHFFWDEFTLHVVLCNSHIIVLLKSQLQLLMSQISIM